MEIPDFAPPDSMVEEANAWRALRENVAHWGGDYRADLIDAEEYVRRVEEFIGMKEQGA